MKAAAASGALGLPELVGVNDLGLDTALVYGKLAEELLAVIEELAQMVGRRRAMQMVG